MLVLPEALVDRSSAAGFQGCAAAAAAGALALSDNLKCAQKVHAQVRSFAQLLVPEQIRMGGLRGLSLRRLVASVLQCSGRNQARAQYARKACACTLTSCTNIASNGERARTAMRSGDGRSQTVWSKLQPA